MSSENHLAKLYKKIPMKYVTLRTRVKKIEYLIQRDLGLITLIDEFRGNPYNKKSLAFLECFKLAAAAGKWNEEDEINLITLKVKGPAVWFFRDKIKDQYKTTSDDQIVVEENFSSSEEISSEEMENINDLLDDCEEQLREQTDPIPLKLVSDFHGRLNYKEQSISSFFLRFEAAAAILNLDEDWKMAMLSAKLKQNAWLYFQQFIENGATTYDQVKERLIALYSEKIPYWIKESSKRSRNGWAEQPNKVSENPRPMTRNITPSADYNCTNVPYQSETSPLNFQKFHRKGNVHQTQSQRHPRKFLKYQLNQNHKPQTHSQTFSSQRVSEQLGQTQRKRFSQNFSKNPRNGKNPNQ